MSHELRTPLDAVLGMNELLLRDKKEPLTEKQSERSKKVVEAGKHLLSIVDDVLDLTRIEAGNVDVLMGLTDCQAVIRDSMKLLEGKAEERNIIISSMLERPYVFAMADSKRLKQIIINLLNNAIKYNKHGGVVTISVKHENQLVNIQVEDTGVGIPEEELPHIFDRFYRCDRSRSQSGIGLGLSLAKAIARAFNGDIRVKSELDQGSSFQVFFPV